MVNENELFYLMSLSQVSGVGPVNGKNLISYCGSAEGVFKEKRAHLAKIPLIGSITANAIREFDEFKRIDNELGFIEKNNIRVITFLDDAYPLRLKQEADSPLVLYMRGNSDLNHPRHIGIVGTRKNSWFGADFTQNLVHGLKEYKIQVISGLAYGIDIAAHKAALEAQLVTIGVVAHGLDILYPGHHKNYARKMIENGGAVISEHMSGTKLSPELFPRRNRIVASLCDCIVVVESRITGGSMVTAEIAHSYNRDIFAVPGKPGDANSEGCNFLIKSLKASLCESPSDIIKNMNWNIDAVQKPSQLHVFQNLSDEEQRVVASLKDGEKPFDDLLFQTQIPIHKLSFLLLDMEMKGILHVQPGKVYAASIY